MATLKQIEANRRNAQKSTGPRTPEGKAISRRNALKTGIDAQAILILGEDKADLEALTADYYQRFAPATPETRCLVDIVIRAEWQLRRLSAVEAELWEHQIEQLPGKEGYLRGHAFSLSDSLFARLQRRIDAAERSFYRALQELERRHESSGIPEPEPPPRLQPVEKQPSSPQIGFVPQPGGASLSGCRRPSGRRGTVPEPPSAGGAQPPRRGPQNPRGASPQFPLPPLRGDQKDVAASPNPCR